MTPDTSVDNCDKDIREEEEIRPGEVVQSDGLRWEVGQE